MTTTLAQVNDARLLGVTGGDIVGLPHNNGQCYAFVSPVTKVVSIIDFRTPGTPKITGSITLPFSPEAISADYETGMVVYVTGSGKLWKITLDVNFIPTLAATYDCPTQGQGGIDMVNVLDGTYIDTFGPFMRDAAIVPHPTASVLYAHDAARQLLHVYSGSATAPYLSLVDSIPTPGAQETHALRLGVDVVSDRLYIVTTESILTFNISDPAAPVLASTVRYHDLVLKDIFTGTYPLSSGGVGIALQIYLQHIASRPLIEGQAYAPLYGEDEDFVTGIPVSPSGYLIVTANKSLGRVTVWQ